MGSVPPNPGALGPGQKALTDCDVYLLTLYAILPGIRCWER